MAEDPFDFLKVLALLTLISMMVLNIPDLNTLN